MTVRTNYEKNLIKRDNLRTFLYASSILGSPLPLYVCFVLEKRVCKKSNFFFNRSKDVLVAHYCFPCLASLDKESTTVRQGQRYLLGRRRGQQREKVIFFIERIIYGDSLICYFMSKRVQICFIAFAVLNEITFFLQMVLWYFVHKFLLFKLPVFLTVSMNIYGINDKVFNELSFLRV